MTEWIKQEARRGPKSMEFNAIRITKDRKHIYFNGKGREQAITMDVFFSEDKTMFAFKFYENNDGAYKIYLERKSVGRRLGLLSVIKTLDLQPGILEGREENGMLVFDIPKIEK